MKSLFIGALALFSLISGAASATTLTIDYFSVPENAGPDFGPCCSSPSPATLPNISVGDSLLGGMPVSLGGPNPVSMVDSSGRILWWTPFQSGITPDGTGSITLPYTNSHMFVPMGTGSGDSQNFETAIVSGSLGAGNDVKLTVTSDDDALVYLNGKYVGGNPGVHNLVTSTLDLGKLNGSEQLEIFYADRADVGAYLSLGVSGVPEPSTWAMMILGFFGVGFMAYRRKQNGPQLRLA